MSDTTNSNDGTQESLPRVSVIMSVYNGAEHFEKAVPSILSQTLEDFEFLIIDDGSDDGTTEFLAELEKKDKRVRIFRLERVGLAKACNHALKFARAPYVARQDFDDTSYPERLAKQVEFLDAHPEVGIVGTHYILVDHNRNERYARRWPTDDKAIRNTMAKSIPFPHTLVMIRTDALREVGGIAEVNNITDLRTWINIAEKGWKMANIPEVLGEHFVYQASYWHKNFKYKYRQRDLAKVNFDAVRRLKLGWWRAIYPAGRYFYCYIPDGWKRSVRRTVCGSKEEDV